MHPTPSTSASPAPNRILSSVRRTDAPSPSKRRKLATPSPASNASTSFSGYSVSTPDPQLEIERRASSSRVLSVWSALEDKYARRLDEGDILDLRSGGLVKDRGVLSGKAGTWTIGCFADAEEGSGESAGPEGEDDDDEDEIGGWGSDSELDHQFNPVHVPPVQELDPEDAEDLRAFLAAEEVRKAEQGIEEDVSEDEDLPDGDAYSEDPRGGDTDGSVIEVEAESALAMSDAESADELDGYDDTVGEGALLWEVGSDLIDNCSEPLAAENEYVTPKPVPAKPRRNMTPAQLRTPPLSRSSAMLPHLPDLPSRRPPLNLSPPSPAKPQNSAVFASTKKGKQKEVLSPERYAEKHDAHPPKGKGKEKEMSVTPTKRLVAEVVIPSPRLANTGIRRTENATVRRCHSVIHHSVPCLMHPCRQTRMIRRRLHGLVAGLPPRVVPIRILQHDDPRTAAQAHLRRRSPFDAARHRRFCPLMLKLSMLTSGSRSPPNLAVQRALGLRRDRARMSGRRLHHGGTPSGSECCLMMSIARRTEWSRPPCPMMRAKTKILHRLKPPRLPLRVAASLPRPPHAVFQRLQMPPGLLPNHPRNISTPQQLNSPRSTSGLRIRAPPPQRRHSQCITLPTTLPLKLTSSVPRRLCNLPA
jgi:hypothetical protein